MRLVLPIFALACALAACSAGGTGSAPSSEQLSPNALPPAGLDAFGVRRTRTYTVATTCSIPGCSNAVVSLAGTQVGTLSYTDGIAYFIPSNITGTVTFLGRTFNDFTGTFSSSGANDWIVNGTFSKGRDTLTETFYVYGHSGRGGGYTITNTGGTVITPYVTPSPTPVPTPRPSPTPRPTPTD